MHVGRYRTTRKPRQGGVGQGWRAQLGPNQSQKSQADKEQVAGSCPFSLHHASRCLQGSTSSERKGLSQGSGAQQDATQGPVGKKRLQQVLMTLLMSGDKGLSVFLNQTSCSNGCRPFMERPAQYRKT